VTNDGRFNEIGPDYAQHPSVRNMTNPYYRSALEEKFPRIADKVVLMWGYPEIITFFESLTLDDRGDRHGFSPDVMSELVFLSAVHDIASPFKKDGTGYANRGGGYSFDLD
jgi:hypothetical protein